MIVEPWLPVGHPLPNDVRAGRVQYADATWQIITTSGGASALLAREALAERWFSAGLVNSEQGGWVESDARQIWTLVGRGDQLMCPINQPKSPDSATDALAFAAAMKETRAIDAATPMHDAIYVEHLGRLLPTYGNDGGLPDDIVLGQWLSGGVHVSATNTTQIQKIMSWLPRETVIDVVRHAGVMAEPRAGVDLDKGEGREQNALYAPFQLVGREQLTAFFQEHVIDIVQKPEIYRKMGIDGPGGIVLFGPTGCGKTFAVECLVLYLGWPCFEIDASSVASPYIHETSKKVAELFNKAIENKPSVLVIDEMDAFLAHRDTVSSQHHVEEVAEFLRRIPEAIRNGVLVIGMTNRVDSIDQAILRRGRFDHLIAVEHANQVEVLALLKKMFQTLPAGPDVALEPLASRLAGRPLSDVTFVVREGARLAARAGYEVVSQQNLLAALEAADNRVNSGTGTRPIGFV